jgi:DNA-binding MarR family transcriptional regulator
LEEQELTVSFDHDLKCWQFKGAAGDVSSDSVQAAIIVALRELGGTATASRIAKMLGKQLPNVSHELGEMVARGWVSRNQRVGREIPYTLLGDLS